VQTRCRFAITTATAVYAALTSVPT